MKNPTKKEIHINKTLEHSVSVILNDRSSYKELSKAVKYILKNKAHADPITIKVAESVTRAREQFLLMQQELDSARSAIPESTLKDKLTELI